MLRLTYQIMGQDDRLFVNRKEILLTHFVLEREPTILPGKTMKASHVNQQLKGTKHPQNHHSDLEILSDTSQVYSKVLSLSLVMWENERHITFEWPKPIISILLFNTTDWFWWIIALCAFSLISTGNTHFVHGYFQLIVFTNDD